jgi:GTPase
MLALIKKFVSKVFRDLFSSKKNIKIGLYGPPNAGKSTLANRICKDWLGEEMSSVSKIAHETREVNVKEQVTIENEDGKSLLFSLVDTPGRATRIDYEDFMKKGMKKTLAKTRAKEATKGVVDAIKWLDDMDLVIVVLDSTMDPYSQVNVTIIGNLEARDIPVLLVANKTDLKRSNIKNIEAAFPQYEIVGISASKGKNIDEFYEALLAIAG